MNTQRKESKHKLGLTKLVPQQSRQLSHARENEQSRHQYIYPKEGKEYQKTWNKERIRKGLATRDRVRSRLREGKVLAPLTSVVLHRIHLCLFYSKGV